MVAETRLSRDSSSGASGVIDVQECWVTQGVTALQTPTAQPAHPRVAESWLFVCRTCARDAPVGVNEASKGSVIAARLRTLLSDANLTDHIRLRVASCLNGCVNPCNVSLRGKGKYTFRFGGLEPGDEPAIVAFAEAYLSHQNGCVPPQEWDESLRAKFSAEIAPSGLSQTK